MDNILNEIAQLKKKVIELEIKCAMQDVEIGDLKRTIQNNIGSYILDSPLSECVDEDVDIPKETIKFNRPRSKSIRLHESKHANVIKLPKIKESSEEGSSVNESTPYTVIDRLT